MNWSAVQNTMDVINDESESENAIEIQTKFHTSKKLGQFPRPNVVWLSEIIYSW